MNRLTFAAAALLIGVASARAGDFATRVSLATCKIFHEKNTGTCVLIAQGEPRRILLVTAAHVLEKIPDSEAVLVLRREKEPERYEREDTRIRLKEEGKALWKRHPTEDVAVLPLNLPQDAPVFPLPLESLAQEQTVRELKLHVGSTVFSAGYPARREANEQGFPIVRHCSIAGYPILPVADYKTFLMDFFAYSGDSGGPVFTSDARKEADAEKAPPVILGLVIATWHNNEKSETPTETREVRVPIGLATVVHAQFILDTIKLLDAK